MGEGQSVRDDRPPLVEETEQLARVRREILQFIEHRVTSAQADGVIVNLSGGLDSTVTATLAVDALGADRVYGLLLPSSKIGDAHAQDAEAVASLLGIEYEIIHLRPLLATLFEIAPEASDSEDPIVIGNLTARLRMSLAYLVANSTRRLVLGTTNRSELLLGYFTKYGDGGVDCFPLGELYKSEVIALAGTLEVPPFVLDKPSTAGFWVGQTDEEDLGAAYSVVDEVLRFLEAGADESTIAARTDADPETIASIATHFEETGHKRRYPSVAPVTERPTPVD